MATNFTMPSMFDTRYAMDRQMELDAQKVGQVGGGGKRYGMYYNSSLLGDRDNAALMSLTGMMGGQGDPRIAKQNAIDTIMQQYPSPETAEDFKAISNALRQSGLYEEADRAMSMANDITAAVPKPTLSTVKIPTMKDGVRYTQTWSTVNGVPTDMLGEQATDAPTTDTKGYKEVKRTNALGQNITETYETVNGVIVPGSKPISTQITSEPDTSVDLETEAYEANLAPYVDSALAKIQNATSTTGILSEEDMTAQARADGIRAYTKVQDLSGKQTDGTAFTKNVDYFLSLEDENGNKLYTLDQAIAQSTSLDHKTVNEEDQILQNKAILEDEQAMAALESTAATNRRLNAQMLSILNRIETGKWENVGFTAAQWLGDFDGTLADKEMFYSLSTSKVMEYTSMTKGAISDAEMSLFIQAATGLGKTTEGNRMLLEFAQQGALAVERMAKHMRAWKAEQKAKNITISYSDYKVEEERYRNSEENAAFFKPIVNSEEWKNATMIGNTMETIGGIETLSKDKSSAMGRFCANPANKDQSLYKEYCK